jgi:hypothetical protein
MFSFDHTLANSPYATVSKFVARFSCLLAFFYPANRLYLLNEDVSTYDDIASVIIGACFIVSAWWAGRLWARYRTIKYLAAQVVMLLFITFYLLTQLVSIPHQWHRPIVIGFLIALWFLAVQRGGESR